jgi:DNA-binding NarL/FixJ family response regulator
MQTQITDTDHSHLVETLSAMILQINALQALLCSESSTGEINHAPTDNTDALHDGLTILEQMTQAALHQARSIDEDILPAQLIGVTLSEALSRAVEETAEKLGLSSRITFSGDEHTLPSYTESLLYRIVQETLYQLEQYTGTRKLRLIFNYGHDEVQMSIEHDGVPTTKSDDAPAPLFTSNASHTTNAVMSDLRHRIEHLGGVLQVNSGIQESRGEMSRGEMSTGVINHAPTSIRVRVPYEYRESANEAQDRASLTQKAELAPTLGSQPLVDAQFGGQVTGETSRGVMNTGEMSTGVIHHAPTVSVLIVESQAVTRAGLHRLLESYPDLQVIGEAADGVQAVSETLELGPQVVLMDMQLSSTGVMNHAPTGVGDLQVSALEAIRQIKQLNLNTQVLVLSSLDREEYLYEALRAGADGYVLKDSAPDELAQAIRTVARGEVLVHPQLARRLLSQISRQARNNHPYESLTAREQEVLRLLARGLRNKEMAARLHVSERTINFHLANLYQKLNVSGRTEALSKAVGAGLVPAHLLDGRP